MCKKDFLLIAVDYSTWLKPDYSWLKFCQFHNLMVKTEYLNQRLDSYFLDGPILAKLRHL